MQPVEPLSRSKLVIVLPCAGRCSSVHHVASCRLGKLYQLVQVLPQKGAGPRALYQALGGTLPAQATVAAPPMP